MKKVFSAILLIGLFSCQEEQIEPQPQDDCNDFCKCGVIVHSFQESETVIRFTVQNNCTGNLKQVWRSPDGTYTGDNLCINECW
jgi:hypothetical protein